ncbi:MAG: SDR family oxidoreductase [Deltaproteobacteria bacterium]|nr:SDR family oxidoreductase [Deltaproteobacteria bacterium]
MSQSVLITGASSGIGESTARHLARRGFRVFGTSRKPHPDDEDGIEWVVMDVCDDDSVRLGVEDVLKRIDQLDAVVCNAGFGIFGAIEEVSIQDARAQLETNFFGVLRVLRAVLPGMRMAAHGRIVLVGSLAGRAPIPFQAHYSASKAAVDALSGSLYNELHAHGIHVSLVEPGDVATPFNHAMSWDTSPADSAYAESIARCEEVIRVSLPKAPPPEDVARTIERALGAGRPRARYTVGESKWLVPLLRRLLPDRLSLALFRRHFNL